MSGEHTSHRRSSSVASLASTQRPWPADTAAATATCWPLAALITLETSVYASASVAVGRRGGRGGRLRSAFQEMSSRSVWPGGGRERGFVSLRVKARRPSKRRARKINNGVQGLVEREVGWAKHGERVKVGIEQPHVTMRASCDDGGKRSWRVLHRGPSSMSR